MTELAVHVQGLSKSFAGVHALQDVDLSVRVGEVHGLLGHNGSGKSTLIKVLSGYHEPDRGALKLYDRSESLPVPAGRAYQAGLTFVYQDLGLISALSVVENFAMLRIAQARGPYYSLDQETRRTQGILDRYRVSVRADDRVADLQPEQRTMVAVVRALDGLRDADRDKTSGPGVLVLDEPTVFLSRQESDRLFELVHELTGDSVSVILVSHDLDEVLRVTDRITVLRDGRVVRVGETAEFTKHDLAEAIVGHRVAEANDKPTARRQFDAAASIKHLRCVGVEDLTIGLGKGEIVGVTGLGGSGHERVPYALFGADDGATGELQLGSRVVPLDKASPRSLVSQGVALLPADRASDAAIPSLSLTDNVTMTRLPSFRARWGLRRRLMSGDTRELLRRFDVRPPEPGASLSSLSGGNQQKVMFAKWTAVTPTLLLLQVPTQGGDIGAREHIWQVMRELANRGVTILCASSDFDELSAVADRVIVLRSGALAAELVGEELRAERIALACYTAQGAA